MPTPWLSCPARLACTRWSATSSASSPPLPPARNIALVSRRSVSAVARIVRDLLLGVRGQEPEPSRQHLAHFLHRLAPGAVGPLVQRLVLLPELGGRGLLLIGRRHVHRLGAEADHLLGGRARAL